MSLTGWVSQNIHRFFAPRWSSTNAKPNVWWSFVVKCATAEVSIDVKIIGWCIILAPEHKWKSFGRKFWAKVEPYMAPFDSNFPRTPSLLRYELARAKEKEEEDAMRNHEGQRRTIIEEERRRRRRVGLLAVITKIGAKPKQKRVEKDVFKKKKRKANWSFSQTPFSWNMSGKAPQRRPT